MAYLEQQTDRPVADSVFITYIFRDLANRALGKPHGHGSRSAHYLRARVPSLVTLKMHSHSGLFCKGSRHRRGFGNWHFREIEGGCGSFEESMFMCRSYIIVQKVVSATPCA